MAITSIPQMNSVPIFESFEDGSTPNRILQDYFDDEVDEEGGFSFIYLISVGILIIVAVLKIRQSCKREPEDDGQVETAAVNIEIPNGNAAVSNGRRPKTKQTATTANTVTTTPITVTNPSTFSNDGPKKNSRWFSPVN